MRLHFVVCKALQREAYLCAARSRNAVDVTILAQGLHNEPDKLRAELQAVIGRREDERGEPYDAVLLGYGLCSNGTVGIRAEIPIVLPRGHDCVTLLLGSKERYQAYFDSHKGVYWYSAGWVENSDMPGPERVARLREAYVAKYGEDNASYLMEMEQGWLREYEWAVYVDWGFPVSEKYRAYTRACADYLGWQMDELKGDASLMQALVDGPWDEARFLTVSPGQSIVADLTRPGIVRAE